MFLGSLERFVMLDLGNNMYKFLILNISYIDGDKKCFSLRIKNLNGIPDA